MQTTSIIGYGNEFRQDDGIAAEVVRRIEALGVPRLRTIIVHQLGPELAEALAEVEVAYFVDACAEATHAPVRFERIVAESKAPPFSHVCDARTLLALTRIAFGRAPEAWLVQVQGTAFGFGVGLSELALENVAEATRQIATKLRHRPLP